MQDGKECLVFPELGSVQGENSNSSRVSNLVSQQANHKHSSDTAVGRIQTRTLLGVAVVVAVLHIKKDHLARAVKGAMIEPVDLAGQLMGLVGHGGTRPQFTIIEDRTDHVRYALVHSMLLCEHDGMESIAVELGEE